MMNHELFSSVTWGDVVTMLLWVFGFILVGKTLQLLLAAVGKMKRYTDRALIQITLKAVGRPMPFIFATLGLHLGLAGFEFSEDTAAIIDDVYAVLVAIAVAYIFYSLVSVVDYYLSHLTSKTLTKMDDMLSPMVRKSLRIIIVVLASLRIGQILSDKPLTTIITGLGVGGLAIALAAQETIKNFFGSMVIFADKPFELGERIKAGGFDGVIEEVGFRSTRIRTLDGHLVTAPNGELANQMIQNIAKRPYIKRVMNITITYSTSPVKVQEALYILREILEDHEGIDPEFPPRVYFNEYNDSSLNILAIYWYHPPEYWKFLAHAEKVNLELFRRYNEAGIDFAFPTRTVYLAKDEQHPLEKELNGA